MCKTLTVRHVDYGMKDLFVATQLSQRTLTLALFLLNYNLLSGLCLIPYCRYLGTTCYRNIIAGGLFFMRCEVGSWEVLRGGCALLFSGLPPCDGAAWRWRCDGDLMARCRSSSQLCSRGGRGRNPIIPSPPAARRM